VSTAKHQRKCAAELGHGVRWQFIYGIRVESLGREMRWARLASQEGGPLSLPRSGKLHDIGSVRAIAAGRIEGRQPAKMRGPID
jgi:hypothetical protein